MDQGLPISYIDLICRGSPFVRGAASEQEQPEERNMHKLHPHVDKHVQTFRTS